MNRLFLTLAYLVILFSSISSRHLVGGHMEYVCLTANETGSFMRLKMVLIRDVSGGGADFDNDAWIGVYEKNEDGTYTYFTTIANISPVFVEELDLSSYLPFSHFSTQVFEKGVYEMDVRLPAGSDYTLTYQRCCYTDDVTNILNSGENGLALTMDISAEALEICDNSPVMPTLPFLLAPIGVEINHLIPVLDPDGNDVEMEYGSFQVAGGTDGVTSGNPSSCNGVRPNSQNCPPPYNTSLFLTPTYSTIDPFGSNNLDFIPSSQAFEGMASITGRYAYAVQAIQSENGINLSVQNIQYTSTFISGLDVGRMIAHPFVDVNANGLRDNGEPPFIGIQLNIDDAISNQVLEDGTTIMKLEPGQYEVESHLPKGWKIYNDQALNASIILSGEDYPIDIPVVSESSEKRLSIHAALSQGLCNSPGLLYLTVRNEGPSSQDLQLKMKDNGLLAIMDHPDGIYALEGNELRSSIESLAPTHRVTIPVYLNNMDIDDETLVEVNLSSEMVDDTIQILLSPVCGEEQLRMVSHSVAVNNLDERVFNHIVFRNDQPGDVFIVRHKVIINDKVDFNSFRIEGSSHPVHVSYDNEKRTIEITMITEGIPATSSGNQEAGGMVLFSFLPNNSVSEGDLLEVKAVTYMDNHAPISAEPLTIPVELQNVSTTDLAYDISVHPNPFTSEVWITGIRESGRMIVYDLSGKVISNTMISKDQRVSMAQLPPGIYFYRFSTHSGYASGRIIKN